MTPLASGGSNFGPTSRKLRDRAISDLERLQKENPEAASPVPAELVTASASGLDPHLSLAGALWQAPRVAKARGVSPERIEAVLRTHLRRTGPGLSRRAPGECAPVEPGFGPAVWEALGCEQ